MPKQDKLLLSFTLLILLFSIDTKSCKGARIIPSNVQPVTNTEFIRSSCSTTTYPTLCFTSLSSYSNQIQNNPRQLANIALSLALNSTHSASVAIHKIPLSRGTNPRIKGALSDCVETVGDSVDELKQSMNALAHLGGKDIAFQLSNIQTWVSAALTDDDTCIDGFSSRNMNGNIKNEVRKYVLNVAQLTSNALAFVNNLANTMSTTSP